MYEMRRRRKSKNNQPKKIDRDLITDRFADTSEDKTFKAVGAGVVGTAAGLGVGAVAGAVGTTLGIAALSSNPIGWAIAAGVVVGRALYKAAGYLAPDQSTAKSYIKSLTDVFKYFENKEKGTYNEAGRNMLLTFMDPNSKMTGKLKYTVERKNIRGYLFTHVKGNGKPLFSFMTKGKMLGGKKLYRFTYKEVEMFFETNTAIYVGRNMQKDIIMVKDKKDKLTKIQVPTPWVGKYKIIKANSDALKKKMKEYIDALQAAGKRGKNRTRIQKLGKRVIKINRNKTKGLYDKIHKPRELMLHDKNNLYLKF
tara:strand:- start:331 stop:1260 length:930 start_codon:yes stop_codon:yes gene_type:complete